MRAVRTINRSVLVIRPREPFLRWVASLDERASEEAKGLESSVSVYLVPEDPDEEEETPAARNYFSEIFERELESWWTEQARWPAQRDFARFQEWFDVVGDSMVIDLGTEPLETE